MVLNRKLQYKDKAQELILDSELMSTYMMMTFLLFKVTVTLKMVTEQTQAAETDLTRQSSYPAPVIHKLTEGASGLR
jgi:hypothetical protein